MRVDLDLIYNLQIPHFNWRVQWVKVSDLFWNFRNRNVWTSHPNAGTENKWIRSPQSPLSLWSHPTEASGACQEWKKYFTTNPAPLHCQHVSPLTFPWEFFCFEQLHFVSSTPHGTKYGFWLQNPKFKLKVRPSIVSILINFQKMARQGRLQRLHVVHFCSWWWIILLFTDIWTF